MPIAAEPSEILLVTPVWNDAQRLAGYGATLARALAASPLPIRWVIADDGSAHDEAARLTVLRDTFRQVFPRVDLHLANAHRGKGAIVREAWALAPDAAWFAFVDADGSVTAEDMLTLVAKAIAAGQSVIGIRKRTATTKVVESLWRGLAHRGFLIAADFLLDLTCGDLQCGAKLIHGGDYRRIVRQLKEAGLAFDAELLATLNWSGAHWLEVPVSWVEKPGSKVRPLRDCWGMLAALFQIRRRDG